VVTVWEYTLGDVFLSMLWFTLFFIWIWLLIAVFSDVFRSDDLSGGGKAGWTILIIIFPYLGVFIYLIVRGKKMSEHAVQQAQMQEAATRSYIQSVAGSGGGASAAEEIERLDALRKGGTISEEEFQAAKAKVLAG
jgi:hypothetical protein